MICKLNKTVTAGSLRSIHRWSNLDHEADTVHHLQTDYYTVAGSRRHYGTPICFIGFDKQIIRNWLMLCYIMFALLILRRSKAICWPSFAILIRLDWRNQRQRITVCAAIIQRSFGLARTKECKASKSVSEQHPLQFPPHNNNNCSTPIKHQHNLPNVSKRFIPVKIISPNIIVHCFSELWNSLIRRVCC